MWKIEKIKFVTLLVVLVMISLVYLSNVFAADDVNKKLWMAGDSVFDAPREALMSGTINGLTFNQGVRRSDSYKMYKGDKLFNYFYMPNFGSTTAGSIKFDVYGDSDIYIIGNSNSNGEERELAIYSTATQKEECIKINGPDGYKYEYKGGAGSIYVYAKSMPIRIYGLGFKKSGYRDNTYSSVNKSFQDALKHYSISTPINSSEIVDGFAFFADDTNTMHIESNGVKDYSYKKYGNVLKMEGTGYNNRYRCVGVFPDYNYDIYITARSESPAENRSLVITNEFYETICDNIIVTNETKTYKVEYKGYDDCLFIKSFDNNIGIYNITLLRRGNDISNDNVWNFGTNTSFENQTITAYKCINELNIYPNLRSVTISDCNYNGYYKVLSLPALDSFNRTSLLEFSIPDSSGQEGQTASRKVVIEASVNNNDIKLILANKAGYVYGVQQMNSSQSTYVFDYNGSGETLCLYGITATGESKVDIYRIKTNADMDVVDGGVKSIDVKRGTNYPLYFMAEDIKKVDNYTYEVKYDSKMLEVVNIGFSDGTYVYGDNGIKIISNNNGLLKFTSTRDDTYWSGLFTVIDFKAKADGSTSLYFLADAKG